MRGEVRRRDSDSIRPRERPRSIQSGHAGASDHVPESGSGAAAELDRTLAKARAPRPHHVRSLLESGGPGQPAPRSGTAGQASRVRVRSAHVHAWNQPFTVHAPTVDERRIVQPQGSGQSYRGYGTITYISPQSRHHQPQTRTPANACAPPRPRLVTERHTAGTVAVRRGAPAPWIHTLAAKPRHGRTACLHARQAAGTYPAQSRSAEISARHDSLHSATVFDIEAHIHICIFLAKLHV